MYIILENNNDPMGGGPCYLYVRSVKTYEEATEYTSSNSCTWRSFKIVKECGQDGNAAVC